MEKLNTKSISIDWFEAARGIAAEQAAALGIGKNIVQTKDDAYHILLTKFSRLIKDRYQSLNPYNRPELKHVILKKFKPIERRLFSWKEIPYHDETYYELDAGRRTVLMDYQQVLKFTAMFAASSIPTNGSWQVKEGDDAIRKIQPLVILDRDFRVIDGINVIQACRSIGCEFEGIRLDYKHQASGLF